jgi:hypothetical protein
MFLELKLVLFRSIFVLSYFLKRVWIGLFLLALIGCMQEPELPKPGQTALDQTTQVRAWFEANKGSLRLPARGSSFRTGSQELILPFFEKEPDWDQVHHYFFPDGREVFEVNLENKEIFIPSLGEQQEDELLVRRSIQNILFVKHPTEARFDPLIVRYYPDAENSKRDFKDINYQMIDEKWSGTVDLFTYDEHFFIGFEIQKGRILATRKVEVTGEGGRRGMGHEQLDIRCSVTTTDWYQVYYNYETKRVEYITLSPTRTYSCAVGGPQGEGSGAGGNYAYLPGDSFPRAGGALGSYNPPDVPLPMLRIYIDSSITDDPRLSCIVDKLALSEFVSSIAEFTKTKGQNSPVTLMLGETTKGIDGKPSNGTSKRNADGTFTIVINKDAKALWSSLAFAKSIFHELVHVEIWRALENGGITPLPNFPANLDAFDKLYGSGQDAHHSYMAEMLMPTMGRELMLLHQTHFPDEFKKFNDHVTWAYPKGVSVDFYENLFWGGMDGTKAYENFKDSSKFPNYQRDIRDLKDLLTKGCTN